MLLAPPLPTPVFCSLLERQVYTMYFILSLARKQHFLVQLINHKLLGTVTYLNYDVFVVKKWRELWEIRWTSHPGHLRRLFGKAVGVGVCHFVSCKLDNGKRATNRLVLDIFDTMNIDPFEVGNDIKVLQCGIHSKYSSTHSNYLLPLTEWFLSFFSPHFVARVMLNSCDEDTEDSNDDLWSLHN